MGDRRGLAPGSAGRDAARRGAPGGAAGHALGDPGRRGFRPAAGAEPSDAERGVHSFRRGPPGDARGALCPRAGPREGGPVMSRVLAVARNTIREVLRERIVLVLAIFGAALVVASQVLSPLALGEGKKVVTDFGLAGSSLLATLLAVFLGSNLLHKELDRQTIYAVMAKPIRR